MGDLLNTEHKNFIDDQNQKGLQEVNPPNRLNAGSMCPRCHADRLEYNDLLQLACPHCGMVEAGAST